MATPFHLELKGDALSILSVRLGRNDKSAFDGVVCTSVSACDVVGDSPDTGTVPIVWSGTAQGAADSIEELSAAVQSKSDYLAFGPAPGMPFFVPKSQCGIGKFWPAIATKDGGGIVTELHQWRDMTKDKFRELPYTFIRKSLRIQDVEVAYWNKSTVPTQVINPDTLTFPLMIQGGPADPTKLHPGYSTIVFDDALIGGGFTHSAWLIQEDGIISTTWIEHRRLNADGTEQATLTRYWKPEDIYTNIILPRINKNMPIKKFGWKFRVTGTRSIDPGRVHVGYYYKPRHISVAQCMFFLAPEWIIPANWEERTIGEFPFFTWEAWANTLTVPPTSPVEGFSFSHYYSPCFVLPCLWGIISDLLIASDDLPVFLEKFFDAIEWDFDRYDTKDPYGLMQWITLWSIGALDPNWRAVH